MTEKLRNMKKRQTTQLSLLRQKTKPIINGFFSILLPLLALIFLGAPAAVNAQQSFVWPNPDWQTAAPAAVGLDDFYLTEAVNYALNTGGGAGQIIRNGYK